MLPQDAARVNVNERYEATYWTVKFKCSQEELKAAVAKIGVSAKVVEAELKKKL
jgi:hypothetical protein